uniref:Virilizer N-terminal domain-containing protein n=1 Tax=Megaselia scalaris TaxID=36166 RepID=T1G9Z6_MEGSC
MSLQGLHCCQIAIPTLEILREMMIYVIQCRDSDFKDITAIEQLLKTYYLMYYFPEHSMSYEPQENYEEETLTKSLWTQMIREVFKNILSGGLWKYMPGLQLLAELLPLPLPIPSLTALGEAEQQHLLVERKLWSFHLHPESNLIAQLIRTICPTSFPQLLNFLTRVCLQLADLAPNMTLLVCKTVIDLIIAEPLTNAVHLARLLNFLDQLTCYASIKISALSIFSGKLYEAFCNILCFTQEPVEAMLRCQLSVHRILEHFFDSEISLMSISEPENSDESVKELNLACALPPKELIPGIIEAILKNLLETDIKSHVSLAASRNLIILSEHDITFYYLKKTLITRKIEYQSWITKVLDLHESGEHKGTLKSLVTLSMSIAELASIVGIENTEEQKDRPIKRIRDILQTSEDLTNKEALMQDIEDLMGKIETHLENPPTDLDHDILSDPPYLPQAESIVTQYSKRPLTVSLETIDDDRTMRISYWTEPLSLNDMSEDMIEQMEKVSCDITEVISSCLPSETNLASDCKRILHLSASPQSQKERLTTAPCFRKRRVDLDPIPQSRPDKKMFISNLSRRGFQRPPPSRGDLFRSRPPNTSRPPSLHVDDFLALETHGVTPTCPTGYNKIPPIIRGGGRGRGRGSRISNSGFRTNSPSYAPPTHFRTATSEPVTHFSSDSHYSGSHFGVRSKDETEEELLFFDTFSHEIHEDINLDLVQFPQPVYITEVRIIPLGARVQADFPGGVRLGATNPSKFGIEFFVNDLGKPGVSTFEKLGKLEYNQNDCINLECDRIPTDGLVLRGWYSTITLAVYGILNTTLNDPIASPPPSEIVEEPEVVPEIVPTIKEIVPFQEPPKENYFERNMRLKKALSPSLGIYKPEITTVLSISHRITGTILSGYTSFLGIGSLVCPHDMSHCIPSMLDSFNMSSTTVTILKFLFAFPFAYHFCAGARHLIWDTGMFLNDKMPPLKVEPEEIPEEKRIHVHRKSRSPLNEREYKWSRSPEYHRSHLQPPFSRPQSPDESDPYHSPAKSIRLDEDEGATDPPLEPISDGSDLEFDDEEPYEGEEEQEDDTLELDSAIKVFDPYKHPIGKYEVNFETVLQKDIEEFHLISKKFEKQTKISSSVEFMASLSVEKENFVILTEQLLTHFCHVGQNLKLSNAFFEIIFLNNIENQNLILNMLNVSLDYECAKSQPQPLHKIRHIKIGIRIAEILGGSAFVLETKSLNVFNRLFALYSEDYMALPIKLLILKAISSILDSEKGLRCLHPMKFPVAARPKFAMKSILKKINFFDTLESLKAYVNETFILKNGEDRSEEIEKCIKEVSSILTTDSVSLQQFKRHLPVVKFSMSNDPAAKKGFLSMVQNYFKINSFGECVLLILTNLSIGMKSTLIVAVHDLIEIMMKTHVGIDYLTDDCFETTQLMVNCLLGTDAVTENIPGESKDEPMEEDDEKMDPEEPISPRSHNLGLQLAFKVQTRYHIDAITFEKNNVDELVDHLHSLYSQTCSHPGRDFTVEVLGLNGSLTPFLDLIEKERKIQVQRQQDSPGVKYKSPVLSYSVDILDCCFDIAKI